MFGVGLNSTSSLWMLPNLIFKEWLVSKSSLEGITDTVLIETVFKLDSGYHLMGR